MSTLLDDGSVPPTTGAKSPNVPQTPSAVPSESRGAEARTSMLPVAATPLRSVPLTSVRLADVEAAYAEPVPTRPVAVTEPPVGPSESSTNDRVVVVVFSTTSLPVTSSSGALEVPASQLNGAETNGPPAGVDTVDGVCDQPLDEPVRSAVVLEAGPEPESLTALVSVNEPAAMPR